MYAVMVGDTMVRVVAKDDAQKLINMLFELDCTERISCKYVSVLEEKKEIKQNERRDKGNKESI